MDIEIGQKVEAFLRHSGLSATRFGRLAVNDPRYVFDLRNGREPGGCVRGRTEQFMNIWRAEAHPDQGHGFAPGRRAV